MDVCVGWWKTHNAAVLPTPHAILPQMSLTQQQEVFVFITDQLNVTAGHEDMTLSFLYLSLSSFGLEVHI